MLHRGALFLQIGKDPDLHESGPGFPDSYIAPKMLVT